jgi:hypothetical protein
MIHPLCWLALGVPDILRPHAAARSPARQERLKISLKTTMILMEKNPFLSNAAALRHRRCALD